MCLVKNGGGEYKIWFGGLRTDGLGLDAGKEVEGLGLGLIEIAGSIRMTSNPLEGRMRGSFRKVPIQESPKGIIGLLGATVCNPF